MTPGLLGQPPSKQHLGGPARGLAGDDLLVEPSGVDPVAGDRSGAALVDSALPSLPTDADLTLGVDDVALDLRDTADLLDRPATADAGTSRRPLPPELLEPGVISAPRTSTAMFLFTSENRSSKVVAHRVGEHERAGDERDAEHDRQRRTASGAACGPAGP